MRKSTYIDYAVLMAVRSGRRKKALRQGLMLIATAFEERRTPNVLNSAPNAGRFKRLTFNVQY